MRLLVIEDEVKLAQYLHKGLSENGHVVDLAHDGIEGKRLATGGEYDLVLLDLMLPGIDGFGVLQAIRAEKGQLPVLMLTARDKVEDRVRGLEKVADDYLVKPFANSLAVRSMRWSPRCTRRLTRSTSRSASLSSVAGCTADEPPRRSSAVTRASNSENANGLTR